MSAPTQVYRTGIRPDVTPSAPVEEQPTIGLIGMGAMGRMYANLLSEAGWKKSVRVSCHVLPASHRPNRINVCDLPQKYEGLKRDYASTSRVVSLTSY